MVEFTFGEIYQRPVLDLRQRQLVIPYGGFPGVLNAIFVAKRVFEERGVSPLNATSEGLVVVDAMAGMGRSAGRGNDASYSSPPGSVGWSVG